MKVDYLIVGQGLAGSLLSFCLMKQGKEVVVIDNGHKDAASKASAGIINPITGRRYVLSWKFGELFDKAKSTYRELESVLGIRVFTQRQILRAINTIEQENDWQLRQMSPEYDVYLREKPESTKDLDYIYSERGWGEINSGAQVDLLKLIKAYRIYLQEKQALFEDQFQFDELRIYENSVSYKNFKADKILFCQGYKSRENPFFSYLPHRPAKGEVLLIELPEHKLEKLVKNKFFVVNLNNGRYWAGSRYINDFDHSDITKEGYTDLISGLNNFLKVPYKVVDHIAGVRPAFNRRRPIIGLHPENPVLGIFNGLGTKGASLCPFWADHFAKFLCGKIPVIDSEVNISGYEKYRGLQ